MVESTDDEMVLVLDYTPQTQEPKHPNFFADLKFWPNVKPFVEGGLAGAMYTTVGLMSIVSVNLVIQNFSPRDLNYQNRTPEQKYAFYKFLYPNKSMEEAERAEKEELVRMEKLRSRFSKLQNIYVKRFPSLFLMHTIKNTMLFGPYGFLSRKVEVSNKGMPLSMYQEVGCAMISGAIGAWVTTPLMMSQNSVFRVENATTQTSLMRVMYHKSQKEGILALWKGGRCLGSGLFAMNVGMLASYNQIYNYLRESANLPADNSVMGAGLASGFVSAACHYPFVYVNDTMIRNRDYPFTGYLDCARKILKSSGPLAFYGGSTRHFFRLSLHAMVIRYFLETVKKAEESYGWS